MRDRSGNIIGFPSCVSCGFIPLCMNVLCTIFVLRLEVKLLLLVAHITAPSTLVIHYLLLLLLFAVSHTSHNARCVKLITAGNIHCCGGLEEEV